MSEYMKLLVSLLACGFLIRIGSWISNLKFKGLRFPIEKIQKYLSPSTSIYTGIEVIADGTLLTCDYLIANEYGVFVIKDYGNTGTFHIKQGSEVILCEHYKSMDFIKNPMICKLSYEKAISGMLDVPQADIHLLVTFSDNCHLVSDDENIMYRRKLNKFLKSNFKNKCIDNSNLDAIAERLSASYKTVKLAS